MLHKQGTTNEKLMHIVNYSPYYSILGGRKRISLYWYRQFPGGVLMPPVEKLRKYNKI